MLLTEKKEKRNTVVLVGSVMSLYDGASTSVTRVDSVLSEEFEVNVVMHQGSVQSPFFLH